MGLFIREMIGWALIAVGLVLVGFVMAWAVDRRVIEAMAISLPAILIFQGGISLVRVATAGRIALRLIDGENRPVSRDTRNPPRR